MFYEGQQLLKAAVQTGDLETFSNLANGPIHVSFFFNTRIDFVSLLPLYCVVYNQPRMLEVMGKWKVAMTMPPANRGIPFTLLQFAKALGHSDCCKEISEYSGSSEEDVDESSDDYIAKLYQVPVDVLKAIGDEDFCMTCLRMLAARGYDVNCKGSEGASPLHEAVRLKLPCIIIETLFSLGSDVNLKHESGMSVLVKFLWKIKYYESEEEVTNILRLIILENPSFGSRMHKRLSLRDLREINKQLLVECGFIHSVLNDLEPSLPSLKERCRTVLRQRYPGKLIFSTVAALRLPGSMRDYILLEHLKQT